MKRTLFWAALGVLFLLAVVVSCSSPTEPRCGDPVYAPLVSVQGDTVGYVQVSMCVP